MTRTEDEAMSIDKARRKVASDFRCKIEKAAEDRIREIVRDEIARLSPAPVGGETEEWRDPAKRTRAMGMSVGDRVIYEVDGRAGIARWFSHDGDMDLDFEDGTRDTVKWNNCHLAPSASVTEWGKGPTPPPAEPDGGDGLKLETTAEERAAVPTWKTINGDSPFMARLLRDHDKLAATIAERGRRIAELEAGLDEAADDMRRIISNIDHDIGIQLVRLDLNAAMNRTKAALLSPATDKGGE